MTAQHFLCLRPHYLYCVSFENLGKSTEINNSIALTIAMYTYIYINIVFAKIYDNVRVNIFDSPPIETEIIFQCPTFSFLFCYLWRAACQI